MDHFFLSLGLIFLGGVLALLLWRQFGLMKALAVPITSAGCLLGLIDAGKVLYHTGANRAVYDYPLKRLQPLL